VGPSGVTTLAEPAGLTPGVITFDTSEGEVFTAGDPRDPTVPPDRVGDAILEGDLVDRDPQTWMTRRSSGLVRLTGPGSSSTILMRTRFASC
jgi:hypothetical protein